MKLTQLLEALDKRGIGEALLRGGEAMQTRIDGQWQPQGAPMPIGALGAMLENGAPAEAVAQWQSENRCQFEQNGFLLKAARKDERVQIAIKRAATSTSTFTETDANSPTVFAPTNAATMPATAPADPAVLRPTTVEWYYLDEGVEQGPIALDRARDLTGAGTIEGDTLVWSDGMADWKPARDSDLRSLLPASALAPAPAPIASPTGDPVAPGIASPSAPARPDAATLGGNAEEDELISRRNNGASWFYWIVGLTIVNSAISLSGFDWGFSLGATVTQVADLFGKEAGTSQGRVYATLFDIVVIAFYAMCGVMAHRGATWAFIVGLVFFTFDSLLSLIGLQIFGILIHGWALFSIFNAMMANVRLNQIARERAVTGMPIA